MIQPHDKTARINKVWLGFLASVAILIVLITLLIWKPAGHPGSTPKKPLVVYCAAGIKRPVEDAALDFEKISGIPIQLQYGGSQTLLSSIQASQRGDIYLPADDGYITIAREKSLITTSFPLARMSAVIGVRKGNPKNIHSLDDLLRDGITFAQANPEAAAIGKLTRDTLQQSGQWDELKQHTRVFQPTVNDVANAIKIGSVDAGLVWDAVARQYDALAIVRDSRLDKVQAQIAVAVLNCSAQPTAAMQFAQYLSATDEGLLQFKRHGYEPVADTP